MTTATFSVLFFFSNSGLLFPPAVRVERSFYVSLDGQALDIDMNLGRR